MTADTGRLLWRCRRGMKELDVLLERFARKRLGSADAAERHTFARFLELPDPLLADYLLSNDYGASWEERKLDVASTYNTERYRPNYANKRGLPIFLNRAG